MIIFYYRVQGTAETRNMHKKEEMCNWNIWKLFLRRHPESHHPTLLTGPDCIWTECDSELPLTKDLWHLCTCPTTNKYIYIYKNLIIKKSINKLITQIRHFIHFNAYARLTYLEQFPGQRVCLWFWLLKNPKRHSKYPNRQSSLHG